MSERKVFAIVDSALDQFITLETALFAADLEGTYPPAQFRIVDMTGKDEIPYLEGATASDLTIDMAGEWQWKLTPSEIALRTDTNRSAMLRMEKLSLLVRKERAELEGPEFIDLVPIIQARIDQIDAELSGVMP